MAKDMGPYIGAIAPFTGFIMTFIPAEDSKELQAIKDISKDMDNQFDQVDNSLKNIERKIDWNQVQIKFGELEQKIWHVDEKYQQFVESTAPAENKKDMFLIAYDDYDGAGTKLYHACINEGLWTSNLPEAIMHYTNNHRNETHAFLLGVEALMLRAMRIELNYLQLKNYTQLQNETETWWNESNVILASKFNETDQKLIDLYWSQSLIDTQKFAADNAKLSNEQFGIKLYDLLTEKYDWRDWFVLIYDRFTGDYKDHYVKRCDGHTLQQNGRTITFESVSKETWTQMDIEKAKYEFKRFVCRPYKLTEDLTISHHIWYEDEEFTWGENRIVNMFYKVNKYFSCTLAVVKSGSHPFYKAPENRVAEWKSDNCGVYMFMFG